MYFFKKVINVIILNMLMSLQGDIAAQKRNLVDMGLTSEVAIAKRLPLDKSNSNRCIECRKVYSGIYALRKHQAAVHLNMRWACGECGKNDFVSKYNVRRHLQVVHGYTKDAAMEVKIEGKVLIAVDEVVSAPVACPVVLPLSISDFIARQAVSARSTSVDVSVISSPCSLAPTYQQNAGVAKEKSKAASGSCVVLPISMAEARRVTITDPFIDLFDEDSDSADFVDAALDSDECEGDYYDSSAGVGSIGYSSPKDSAGK